MVGAALALRLVRLASVPGNVTADELDNLQTAYRILEGKGPGFFGLDWKPSPAFSSYLLAASVKLFGSNIVALRLPSVVLSTLALIPVYFLARQVISRPAALLSAVLLATSLWYLHFSRSGWENIHGAFYGTSAALSLSLALKRRSWLHYGLCGFFSGLGLLGHHSSTLLLGGILAYLPPALLIHRKEWKQVLLGYGLILLVSLTLFAPTLKTMLVSWEYATARIREISIFAPRGEYLGDTSLPAIFGHQVLRISRGFFLMDTDVMGYGLWGRYVPPQRAFLDLPTSLFYWIGLGASLYYWRQTLLWWSMLLLLLVPQVLSTATPDAARGVPAAPFMYLFVALGLHAVFVTLRWLLRRARFPALARALALAAALPLVIFIARANVTDYDVWQGSPWGSQAREPAVEARLFPYWQDLARQAARQGRLLGGEEWTRWLEQNGLASKPQD